MHVSVCVISMKQVSHAGIELVRGKKKKKKEDKDMRVRDCHGEQATRANENMYVLQLTFTTSIFGTLSG